MRSSLTLVLATIGVLSPSLMAVEGLGVKSIRIENDVVYFQTHIDKAHSIPSCVSANNNPYWTLSLNTASGKASYSLLVTAVSEKRQIAVKSAGDCLDASGYERAISVELGDAIAQPPVRANARAALYQGDRVTKIGEILTATEYQPGKFSYQLLVDVDGVNLIRNWSAYPYPSIISTLYYEGTDCTGRVGFYDNNPSGFMASPWYKDGKFLKLDTASQIWPRSQKTEMGICYQMSGNERVYPEVSYDYQLNHPQCGVGLCQVRVD
ncbi:hypothetical protein N473_07525 [Pseudoalteromonas luteoviolacea CPMOR-1]|uniref:Uncharacterized protein n=1 Tax=Pseudoalteromonas luteoviolacea CPMOR-1 TaxID=1365248 RepID=A0A162BTL7_9GAMM|nr:hypothetical protein [Pseudoalteromonas luteoviolacea]KZN68267.1 hypothetical protein N473_07525 [Pseudoalteromonas luteoviolacea CPMOR-1]